MRVLQLIDSLRPGGAEKMAVNIANALLPHVECSYLCCTRQEGLLKNEIKGAVGYFFLNKKSSMDPKAILKLRKFIIENKINIVHAHSTSFFLAGLLKLSGSKFKLIWHDHYGESEHLKERQFTILKLFSRIFNGIISVNYGLKIWAKKNLYCRNVVEIKNFIPEPDSGAKNKIFLLGNKDDFKIISVANLRPQKDHFNLLKAFENLDNKQNCSLHLIGEDPGTAYSAAVLGAIKISPKKHKIYYYGMQQEIIFLLKQADLGVLASRSEGLPLVLLEYGFAGLPVVSTDVGKCPEVIGNYGILVPAGDKKALSAAINKYINNASKRNLDAKKLNSIIVKDFSEESNILNILDFYKIF